MVERIPLRRDWLMRNRRLVRDHEETESSASAFIHFALIRLMLQRLA
jgi:hypothetical protein